MRIQHNIMAMNAYRNYTNNTSALAKNLEKLSSGYRINRAGDDAAGLAISEKMRAQITALGTAQKNVKDGISLVKTAEGATQEIHDMLNRMVDLATQSANGTYQNEVDREAIEDEFNALKTEIDRIADSSNFNGIKLLDGSLGLNTDVFKVAAGNAYTAATSETTSNLTPIDPHGGAAVAASPASFTVNLKELEATIATGATNKVTFTINIAGQNVTASFAGAGAAATKSATDVAAAIKAAYTGTSASKSIKIGDAYFKASNTGGVLTFTMAGYDKAGTFTGASAATAMENLSEDQVKAINDKLSTAKVSVSAAASGTASWANVNNIDHGITPTLAVAKKEGGLLGAEYDITNLLANGAKLELDDQTFTVKMGAGATGTGNTLAIDTDKYATEAEQMAKLKELLTAASTTNFNINTAAGNKISVDQKASGAITGVKTMADVTAKLTAPGQAEQIASTKLYVTGAAEKGNVLNIGDDKITFNGGEDIDAVKSAIEGKGYTVTKETDSDGKAYLNIQGKATDADGNTIASKDITAPTVLGKGLTLQIGEDSQSYNQLSVAITDMHSESLGLNAITLKNQDGAQAAVDVIKNAINSVSSTRGKLGATQNRLEHTANNLSTMKENIQDAEATIRDTDIAEEMMAYTKNNILVQSAQAMLAQANQIPQGVLQLLG